MIAKADHHRPGRPDSARMAAIDRALAVLSAEQDRRARAGRQVCFSQAEISRRSGLTRSRVEQLETAARLNFLRKLATACPGALLELGGNYAQLAFLQRIRITSTNARRLWRRWVELGDQAGKEGPVCPMPCCDNMN